MTYLQVFLKICEGCGSLWFRAHDSVEIYCPACAPRMHSLLPGRPSGRHVPHRRRKPRCNGGAA
jgi:hypothetical protein